ncbi:unnamed protein product [Urochloa humidicola]
MAHQGDFGGNPLGHFTPPFPATPSTVGGAQAGQAQAPFQANPSEPFISGAGMMPWSGYPGANALAAPPPQAFQPESHHPYWTMPQAGAPNVTPFQHFAGAGAAVQPPPPLHGAELAARMAAINVNILASQPFQPNNYTHGWPQAPVYNQAPQPFGNIGAPAVGPNGGYGAAATGWALPMPHPGWPTAPMQQPGGDTSWAAPTPMQQQMVSWAPPAQQQPGGGTMSWAAPAQQPGVFPGGSAHQAPALAVKGKTKTFEEFLMDAGVLDDNTVDEMLLDGLMKDLMENDAPTESGPVQPEGQMVGVGGNGLPPPPPPAVGSYSEETAGGGGRDPEAAAEAKARRGRRMAKRKEAIARARTGN